MQSRAYSLLETLFSTSIGYMVALLTQLVIFPLFSIQASFSDNALIAAIFTVISIARGYAVRRLFNYLGYKNHKICNNK